MCYLYKWMIKDINLVIHCLLKQKLLTGTNRHEDEIFLMVLLDSG